MNNKKFAFNELLLDLEIHMQIYVEALKKISLSEGSKTTMKRIANQALSTAPSIETAKEAFLDNIKTPYEHDKKRLVELKKLWDAISTPLGKSPAFGGDTGVDADYEISTHIEK